MSKVKRCSKCKECFRTSGKGKICSPCKVENRFFNSSAGRWLMQTIIRGGYWSVLEYTTQDDLIELFNIHKRCGSYRGWRYNADNKKWSAINELDIAHLYPVKGDNIGILHPDNIAIAPSKLNKIMGNTVFNVGIGIERYDPVATGDLAQPSIRSRLKERYDLKTIVKSCNLKAKVAKVEPDKSFECRNPVYMIDILVAEVSRFKLKLSSTKNTIEQFKEFLKGELPSGETCELTAYSISMNDLKDSDIPY